MTISIWRVIGRVQRKIDDMLLRKILFFLFRSNCPTISSFSLFLLYLTKVLKYDGNLCMLSIVFRLSVAGDEAITFILTHILPKPSTQVYKQKRKKSIPHSWQACDKLVCTLADDIIVTLIYSSVLYNKHSMRSFVLSIHSINQVNIATESKVFHYKRAISNWWGHHWWRQRHSPKKAIIPIEKKNETKNDKIRKRERESE